MKNIAFIFSFLFFGWSAMEASEAESRNAYNDTFIFIEGGVEFAVYPNGEFDFYYNPQFKSTNSINISTPNVNISYNSGYNYDAYVQYDDYGAVIQVESVPVYYDYYGRIIRAGNVFLDYNIHGNLAQVGNLQIDYNRFNRITSYSGFINNYNKSYVYRPWHQYYVRPHSNVSIVFGQPYRAYYQPNRITYVQHINYYKNHFSNNSHRNFYRPNQTAVSYNKGRRTTGKRDLKEIKNDKNRMALESVPSNANVQRSTPITTRSRTLGSEKSNSTKSRGSAIRTSTSPIGTNHTVKAKSSRTESKVNTIAPTRSSSSSVRPERTVRSSASTSRTSSKVRNAATRSRTQTSQSSSSRSRNAVKSSTTRNSSGRTTNSSRSR